MYGGREWCHTDKSKLKLRLCREKSEENIAIVQYVTVSLEAKEQDPGADTDRSQE